MCKRARRLRRHFSERSVSNEAGRASGFTGRRGTSFRRICQREMQKGAFMEAHAGRYARRRRRRRRRCLWRRKKEEREVSATRAREVGAEPTRSVAARQCARKRGLGRMRVVLLECLAHVARRTFLASLSLLSYFFSPRLASGATPPLRSERDIAFVRTCGR